MVLPKDAGPITGAELDAADAAADAAQAAAGVRIRELTELPDLAAICELFDTIWRPGPGEHSELHPALLRAMTKAGNFASGAYDVTSGELVGACMGFFGPPGAASLHSHIAGVLPAGLGRAVGFALKVHQRAWCLHRDTPHMHWTYDPLIRRNAYFNLAKLGARPVEYLPDFYGPMNDSINGATESDRMLVHWDLRSELLSSPWGATPRTPRGGPDRAVPPGGRPPDPRERGPIGPASPGPATPRGGQVVLEEGPDGWPVRRSFRRGFSRLLVGVPADVEAMRAADPARAAAWRGALREALAPLLAGGARVTGFDRDGWYIVSQEHEQEESRS